MNRFNHTPTIPRVSICLCLWACLVVTWSLLGCPDASSVNASTPSVDAGVPASDRLVVMAPNGGPAIGGYDPVSYFLDGGPRKGSQDFSYEWQNATWFFATAEHRELFKNDPSQYVPAYGGFCAFGMAEGLAAESDPLNAWKIHQGKLYFNWDAEALEDWEPEIATHLAESESRWPEVRRSLQNGTEEIYWNKSN